jgi:hypothetical protein
MKSVLARALILAAVLGTCAWKSLRLPAQAPAPPGEDARRFVQRLTEEYPDAFDEGGRAALKEALGAYYKANNALWNLENRDSLASRRPSDEELSSARLEVQAAGQRLAGAMKQVPRIVELHKEEVTERRIEVRFGSAVVIVHGGANAGPTRFIWRRVSASSPVEADGEVPGDGSFFVAFEFRNVPASGCTLQIPVRAGGSVLGELRFRLTSARVFPLHVAIETDAGTATEATIGLYSEGKRFLVPETALDFSEGGQGYGKVRYLYNRTSRYWPGKGEYVRAFYHSGPFTMQMPEGKYRLMATKGPEFEPFDGTIAVVPGTPNKFTVRLKRWINMSAFGWHSGDSHLHFERRDKAANERLAVWVAAEDVRMANVVRMGDGRYTYYEQYAYGKEGRYVRPDMALVPGQEDPRTNVLGHTLQLNLQSAIRFLPGSYYVYADVFDETHNQGGLAGYAHVNSRLFNVDRDMTLNIPLGKVDFAEICEAGNVRTELYYEFLNLGYRLTATGGSDVPYYGSAGDSRVYVYTGRPFRPDDWFTGLQNGRTFVTAGPMLEFSVDGNLPGAQLTVPKRTAVRVHARVAAGAGILDPEKLEIVANGEVVRSADAQNKTASLDFELPAAESMWIAARSRGSHTTPVYITVSGRRHWNRSQAPALLDKRLAVLATVEKLVDAPSTLQDGERIQWENRDALLHDRDGLRAAIARSRQAYAALHAELQADTAGHVSKKARTASLLQP